MWYHLKTNIARLQEKISGTKNNGAFSLLLYRFLLGRITVAVLKKKIDVAALIFRGARSIPTYS